MILLASWATGLLSAVLPPVNIEAYLVGLGALRDGPLLWLAVLAVTVGHMLGKLLFYSLGRGWLVRRLAVLLPERRRREAEEQLEPVEAGAGAGVAVSPSVRAQPADDPRPAAADGARARAVRARLASWSGVAKVQELVGRPWATAVLCFGSSCFGVPPFAVVAVLLGRFRMPVVAFLLVGGAGRFVRFAAVAGLSGAVLG
jgi:membrane protein YqaA with SNARE-associated domain